MMLSYKLGYAVYIAIIGILVSFCGCAGGGDQADPGPDNPHEYSISLDAAIKEIEQSPRPDGVNAADYELIRDELIRVIRETHSDRIVSAPPAGQLNAVENLALFGNENQGYVIRWSYRNRGDYDLNGEVNSSDLVPIAIHFNAVAGGPGWEEARVADGNMDGEINVADITPIGQNYRALVESYRLYSSTDSGDYPADPDGANGGGAQLVQELPLSGGEEDGNGRLQFSASLPGFGQTYWVRPASAGSDGACSNELNLMAQLFDNTKVLDQGTLDLLTDFTDGTMTFASSSPLLDDLQFGDILAAGPSVPAPYGFLQRVTAVNGSGPVTVTSEPAQITDALTNTDFSLTIPLNQDGLKQASSSFPGVELLAVRGTSADEPEFFIGLNNVLIDEGDPLDPNDDVRLNGSLGITPELIFELQVFGVVVSTSSAKQGSLIGPAKLGDIKFGVGGKVQGGLTISGDAAADWDRELTLATYEFTPIIFLLGAFPVMLTPSLDLIAGSNGTSQLEFMVSATADAYMEAAIDVGFSGVSFPHDYGFDADWADPVILGNVHAHTYAGARANLLLYYTVGGTCTIDAYIDADADVTADPWWKLCAGVEAKVGLHMLLLDYDHPFFNKCWPLADAGGPFGIPSDPTNWGIALDHDQAADYDEFNSVLAMPDGGCVAAGSSFLHPLIVRTDAAGKVKWQKLLSTPGLISGLALAPDGTIVACGKGTSKAMLLRLDGSGNVLWQKTLDTQYGGWLHEVESIPTGGFVAVGELGSESSFAESWIVTVADNGSLQTSTTFGSADGDYFMDICLNPDGSFYAVGEDGSGPGVGDAWLCKLDSSGAAQWHKRLSISGIQVGDFGEWAMGVSPDGSGGCYLTGQTNRGALSLWAAHFSGSSGDWVRLIDQGDFALTWDVTDIVTLRSGNLVISGRTGTAAPLGGRDAFLVNLSPGGSLGWAASFGGGKDDGFFGVTEKIGGLGIIAAGHSESFRTDNEQDAMVLMVTPSGNISFTAGGAGRSFLDGEFTDEIDSHYSAFTPVQGSPATTAAAESSSTSDFGAAVVRLTD